MLHSRRSKNRRVNPAMLTVPCRVSMTSVRLGLAPVDNGQLRHIGHRAQLFEAMLLNCRTHTGSKWMDSSGPVQDPLKRTPGVEPAVCLHGPYCSMGITGLESQLWEEYLYLKSPFKIFVSVGSWTRTFLTFSSTMVPQEYRQKMHTRVNMTTSHGPWYIVSTHDNTHKRRKQF